MKKLFLSLFVAGSLTFGLQSCDSDPCEDVICDAGEICDDGDCVVDPNSVCDFCGSFSGTMTGNVTVDGEFSGTFTETDPLAINAEVRESNGEYILEIDLEELIPGLFPIAQGGVYNPSTGVITFNDAPYTYNLNASTTLDFLINGTVDLSVANSLDASVTLTGTNGTVASGVLDIEGTK